MSDIDSGERTSRRLWFLAAFIALALHIGGAAWALTELKGDDDDDGLGVSGAEVIDVDMASPKIDDDQLPQGEDHVAQTASQATPEQKAEPDQTDLPKDVPTQTDEADRSVTTSDVKKPTEEEKTHQVETKASEAQEADIDSSRKAIQDVPEADKAKAPNQGIGKDRSPETKKWENKLTPYLKLHQKYPEKREKTGKGATVVITLSLNRRGNVVSAVVQRSSGDSAYDDTAIAMVHSSDPFPAPPASDPRDEFLYNLTVNFNRIK